MLIWQLPINWYLTYRKYQEKHTKRPQKLNLLKILAVLDLFMIYRKKNSRNPIIVSSTDGVGTKLEIANKFKKFDTIGIDLVAMCVNDLIVQGAKPIFFLDYIAINKIKLNKS